MKNTVVVRTSGKDHRKNILISLLLGSLAWAITMLFFSPRSETRTVREHSHGKANA